MYAVKESYSIGWIPAGQSGTDATVAQMKKLIRQGVKDPRIRRHALQILRSVGVSPRDYAGEIRSVYNWVKANVRYTKDPDRLELLTSPQKILELGAGDCDDYTVLLSALLGSLGHTVRIKVGGDVSGLYRHVWPEVQYRGRWIPLDAATPRPRLGKAPELSASKPYSLEGNNMPLTVRTPGENLQMVPVAGDDYYRETVQATLNYFGEELAAGRLKAQHLALYKEVVPREPKFSPLTKSALLKAVDLAAHFHFGMTPDRLRASLAGYSPSMGDLADMEGFLKSIVKAVGGVVKGAINIGKKVLGIPEGAPVAIKVEVPTGTPQPVSIAPGVTAQVVPQIGAGAILGPVGDFLKNPMVMLAIGLALFFLLPKGGKRRRGK